MKTFLGLLAVSVLAAVALVRADEEAVPLDKAPKAVIAAVKKRFPDAKMTEASKETIYEVTVMEAGKKIDITLTEGGEITTLEKQIDAADLPKAVRDGIDAKYPKATYKVVEQVVRVKHGAETVDYYEALLETADKKTVEVEVAADGTIKKTEDKKAAEGKEKKEK